MPLVADRRFAERFAAEQAALARSLGGSKRARQERASLLLHRLMFERFLQNQTGSAPVRSSAFRRFDVQPPEGGTTNRWAAIFTVPTPGNVSVPDRVLAFLNEYDWCLDDSASPADDRLTPAVIGPLFEKHVNRKEQGAYYTKDDVTAYLASRTIVPFLLDALPSLPWHLLAADPERYLPASVRAAALLPGESAPDQQARRCRRAELRALLRSGAVGSVNDLVTLNLDLELFAADVVASLDEVTLHASFEPVLRSITVLDPTCGSGAFLVAALRVLERLWLAAGRPLREARRHIVSRNLFGIDRMPEAVELCRMRLLLELAAADAALDDPAALVAGIRVGDVFDEFAQQEAGFDVILGNPPYLPAAGRRSQMVAGYRTERCPDVYAWVLERSAALLRRGGRCGMIVPLSLGFSAAFASCRELLFEVYGTNWFASFGRIPAALFAGDIRVRNTIHIGHKPEAQAKGGQQYTTHLHRWFESARPHLFQTLGYVPFEPQRWRRRVPKLNSTTLARALEERLQRQPATVAHASGTDDAATPHGLYFKKTAYNWLTFCRRLPPCFDAADMAIAQTQFDALHFADEQQRDLAFLFLNGKWAFAFWAIVGDDFHVARWMFNGFPIDLRRLPAMLVAQLRRLAQELEDAMEDALAFKRNAGKRVGTYNLARCRHVTDRSDRLFAEALGLRHVWNDVEALVGQVVKTDFGVSGRYDDENALNPEEVP